MVWSDPRYSQGMAEDWITDRPPTEADGDKDGDVLVQAHPTSGSAYYFHWSRVVPGLYWRPVSEARR